jgi:hypothetical protein
VYGLRAISIEKACRVWQAEQATAVQIYAPHPLIGPAFNDRKFQLTGSFGVPGFIPVKLQFGAVAVITGFGFDGIAGRRQF